MKPSDPLYPPWRTVLDDVARAGYAGVDLGPLGYFPEDAVTLGAEVTSRGLAISGGTVMRRLDDQLTTDDVLQQGAAAAELVAALGAPYLVVIDGIVPERERTAGRSGDAERLEGRPWRTLIDTVSKLGEMAASMGLVAAFHPHAATRIEFRDEIDRLLDETDPETVRLCVDTGHVKYAGVDPVQLMRDHAQRLACVHLKDVDPSVLEDVCLEGLGFWDGFRRAVFCVLGRGSVDFSGVRDVLQTIGYDGWVTVEQDADPTTDSDPFADAVASLDYLHSLGITEAARPSAGPTLPPVGT